MSDMRCAIAPQLEHWAVNQEDRCSSPTAAITKLGQFHSPHFARVF